MQLQKISGYCKSVFTKSSLRKTVSPQEKQRLQNCAKLERELNFVYLQALTCLRKSSKGDDVLHRAYIALIEACQRCEWAGLTVPYHVTACREALTNKAFSKAPQTLPTVKEQATVLVSRLFSCFQYYYRKRV
ncbi:MAG: hypothetical protein LW809_06660 [Vampirovibrionales bacterium]|jgi:hypothetical protein|nr:hypothetical protein [Vampirovibrionales bacterium]